MGEQEDENGKKTDRLTEKPDCNHANQEWTMNSYDECKAIVELDLDPIKVKLMHKPSGEGWTLEQANAVEKEYRRFLYLIKKFPDEDIVPRADVDLFWHYHILDTRKYAEDCQALFGHFLHHFPYLGLDHQDAAGADEAAQRTQALYQQTYASEAGAMQATAVEKAFCSVTAARPFCSATKPEKAFCSVTANKAFCSVTGDKAFCSAGVGKAFCSVTNDNQATRAFCSVTSAKSAFCSVTAAKPAFCSVTAGAATMSPASVFCSSATRAAFCSMTSRKSTLAAQACESESLAA
jgi:hypothetical protein